MNRSELRVKKLGFWGDKRLALTNRNLHDSNLDRYVLWRQDQPWSLSVHGVVCVLFFLVVSYLSHHVFQSNLLAGGSIGSVAFVWLVISLSDHVCYALILIACHCGQSQDHDKHYLSKDQALDKPLSAFSLFSLDQPYVCP